MNIVCLNVVEGILGRKLTPKQEAKFDSDIYEQMRLLATQDRAGWIALPRDEQLRRGAQAAAQAAVKEATDDRGRRIAHIQAWGRTVRFVNDTFNSGASPDKWHATQRLLATKFDSKDGGSPINIRAEAISGEYIGVLADAWMPSARSGWASTRTTPPRICSWTRSTASHSGGRPRALTPIS